MSAAPRTLAARLGRPVDGASLGFFRMAAGALFAVELLNDIANGDFAVIGAPTMHFHYAFFAWVRPAAPVAVHWAVTIGLALAVSAGAALRVTAPLLFVSWTWIFLMERSEYVNHTYLYCWITFWLATLPIGDALSIDGARRRSTRAAAPTWVLGLFRFQMAVVYVFSGLAKLDADWLAGIPLDLWLPNPAGPRILVPILSTAAAPIAIAWGGLVFDLAITPLVLWSRTRRFAFAAAVLFHASNAAMFGLSSFPWFSIAATTLFLDPSWPRRFAVFARRLPPFVAGGPFPVSRATIGVLAAVVALHLALPLRHHLYPGDAKWTEEGHMFAWRMMLRTKQGTIRFAVHDPESGEVLHVRPVTRLPRTQARQLPGQPDMILEFAHALADERERRGHARPRVFAEGRVSLNGRPSAPLVDPAVDLAAERWTLRPWRWIEPEPPAAQRSWGSGRENSSS